MMENSIQIWKCPIDSCNHEEIELKRTDNNMIKSKIYEKIIIHFLKHLKKDNVYFGSTDLYKIFEENIRGERFYEEDLRSYESDPSHHKWQTNLRSVLDRIIKNERKYIETDEINSVPEEYNKDIVDKRKRRTRRRTEKFLQDYHIYDDWELYEVPTKSYNIHRESSESEKIQKSKKKSEVEDIVEEPKEKTIILVIYKENMVMSKNDIEYFIPEISVYLSNGDQSLRREFFKSEAYTWRRKLHLLNLDNDFKKYLFYNKIKEISREPDVQLYNVNLILDLNRNELFINQGSEVFEKKIKLPFSSYKVHSLNEQEFRNILTRFKCNQNLEEPKEASQGQMCPSCGNKCSPRATRCPKCNQSLVELKEAPQGQMCSSCGNKCSPRATRCPKCNKNLKQ